jgi:lipopolysaccharide export system permease protein
MREQQINNLPPYSIRAARVFGGSGRLLDVEIYDLSLVNAKRVIYADSGIMAFSDNGQDLILRLFVGRVHEYDNNAAGQIQISRFAVNTVRVKDVQNLFERDSTNFRIDDREMTVCQMMDEVDKYRRLARHAAQVRVAQLEQDLKVLMQLSPGEAPAPPDTSRIEHCGVWRTVERAVGRILLPEVAVARAPNDPPPFELSTPVPPRARGDSGNPSLSSLAEIQVARADAAHYQRRANAFSVEIHKKYSISIACFTFVLIGVALALRFPRGGMGLVIGGGLAIFALFYVCLVGGEALGDVGTVSPVLAMGLPNVLVLLSGIAGLLKVNREFGSTRGGDLSDLFDIVRRPFRTRRSPA